MKVESYQVEDWDDVEHGLLVSENDEWILVKHIPVDYQIDGYRLYRKSFIESRLRSDEEELVEKVLKLKGIKTEAPNNFNFSDTIGLLKWVEETYGLYEFQDDDEEELYYGKTSRIIGNNLTIHMIKVDGSVEKDYDDSFKLNEIRAITFETDYHLSIGLLWKDKQK